MLVKISHALPYALIERVAPAAADLAIRDDDVAQDAVCAGAHVFV